MSTHGVAKFTVTLHSVAEKAPWQEEGSLGRPSEEELKRRGDHDWWTGANEKSFTEGRGFHPLGKHLSTAGGKSEAKAA